MKSKILMLVVALMLAFSTVASAEALNQPELDDTTGALTISGQIEGYGYADAFTLAVFNAGKSYQDMSEYTPEEIMLTMTHFGTFMTDAEGNYEVIFSTKNLNPGDYTVVLTAKDGAVYSKAIFVASRDSKIKFVGEVADLVEKGCTADELKAKLGLTGADAVNAKVFEILEDNVIFTVDADALSAIVLANIKDTENFEETTPEDFVTFLENCAYIQKVNAGELNPADKPEFFGLDEKYMETYTDSVTDKDTFADNFKDGGYKYTSEIADYFETAVIMNVLENADSWKDYKSLINAHGEDLGIDMDDYEDFNTTKKDKISGYMANSYDSIDDFVDDVNSAIKDIKKGKSSGGGGGSSGRGTSGITGVDINNYPIDMTPVDETVKFTDLEGFDWAKEAIDALSKDGVVAGVGGGKFVPAGNVTREQFVKMIVEAFDVADATAPAGFEDTVAGAWYESYVNSAVENGIVAGIGNGNFGVGMNITREDVAVILYRVAKLSAQGDVTFGDKEEIADYALDAVKTLNNMNVIGGVGNGNFAPKANCSRAEAAVMIYRLLGTLNK